MHLDRKEAEAQRLRLELRLALLERRERSKAKFLDFARYAWPEAIFSAHHSKMADAFDRIISGDLKRLIINMPPRHAILTSMNIPTTAGFKTMADLQPGDFVFGPDGEPTEVICKSEVFLGRALYRVTTDDGAYLDVDGEHLWTVRLDRKRGIYKDYTTEQLLRRQNGEILRTKRGGGVEFLAGNSKTPRLPMLPSARPAQHPESVLLVDPYVLGLWLGDGSKNNGVITSDDVDSPVVRAEIERRGYATTDQATKYTFGVLGLKVQLRELGVLADKHIPEQYMVASPRQRRDLLKGLMDSDGTVSKKGQCYFCQSNLSMIKDVARLVRSLGMKGSISSTRAKIGENDYGLTWRVSFYGNDVFCLPRKESRTLGGDRHFGRYIKIEKLDSVGDVQCIRVAREDGLFLAGDGYMVTHNTKSEFGSYLLPAYAMGRKPDLKIIQATHTGELAVRFGRKVRNLMDTQNYKDLFEGVELQADSKAAGRWETNRGGEYFAVGVGGAMTGRGADLLIIDDPHSEQDAMSALALENAWEWYSSGPRSRLQPGGAVVVIMTRWGTKDLSARLVKSQNSFGSDKWEVIEFPAIFDEGTDRERPLWPSFWKLEELQAVRAQLGVQKWNAMYQQRPTSDEGAILKREWWQIWRKENLPSVEYVIQSYDTAYSKKETADYSVITTWGVFYPTEDSGANLILMHMRKGRWDFPDLKRIAKELYTYWQPDNVLIEAKATGVTLQQELRRMGIPVTMYTPGGRRAGQDKVSRANAVAPMLESGMIWATEDHFAQEVIEECASFPNGDNDDIVDSTTQAWLRFRAGNFISLQSDEEDESSDESLVPEYY